MTTLLASITWTHVLIYFACAFVFWYIAYGIEMYLNGGKVGRGRFWVFSCFWEELLWFLPGGLARRVDHIREMVRPQVGVSGYLHGYSYEQIREKNLYEVVAKKALGNGCYFWGVNVVLMFFLWPLTLAGIALLLLFENLVCRTH